jgi:hypothetical protein
MFADSRLRHILPTEDLRRQYAERWQAGFKDSRKQLSQAHRQTLPDAPMKKKRTKKNKVTAVQVGQTEPVTGKPDDEEEEEEEEEQAQ